MFPSRITGVLGVALLGTILGCSRAEKDKQGEQFEPEPAIAVPDEDLKALAEGNNAFAIDLYKKVAEEHEGNLILSPYSISSALAMTYAGARGQTATEMATALHFRLPQERLHPAFRGMNDSLNASGRGGRNEVAIANSLWKQKGFAVEPNFSAVIGNNYAGSLQEANFAGDAEGSIRAINEWTEKHTKGRIKSPLRQEMITQQTQLVLVNTVYFQGRWNEQFEKSKTRQDDFEIEPGRKVPVMMMCRADTHIRYAETADYSLLELPYIGDRWAMVFLVPTKRFGLREVERKLTAKQLSEALQLLTPATRLLNIPRFKMNAAYQLPSVLKELGMRSAFSPSANFTGLCRSPRLQIADVMHGVSTEVDETGTVAAAATVVTMQKVSDPIPLRIDQPFILIIVDKKSHAIAFVGRIIDPR